MPRGASTRFMVASVGVYLRDMSMAALASAWAIARGRPKKYRRKVDAEARFSGSIRILRVGNDVVRRSGSIRARHRLVRLDEIALNRIIS